MLPGTRPGVFLDRLEGKRDGCLLGEPTRRRPVLPVPAPPRRGAVRRPVPDPPVVCPGFGFDRSNKLIIKMINMDKRRRFTVQSSRNPAEKLLVKRSPAGRHMFLVFFDSVHTG